MVRAPLLFRWERGWGEGVVPPVGLAPPGMFKRTGFLAWPRYLIPTRAAFELPAQEATGGLLPS